MAEKSSFFNSVNHDRTYSAADWAEYFATFISNGVFPQPAVGLGVTAGDGMTVLVAPGSGYINGYKYTVYDDPVQVALATAPSVLKRIDRVVFRWDRANREITAAVVKGAEATAPAPPALTRTADVWELCLAEVTVDAGVTEISQSKIRDTRYDSTLCGVVGWMVDDVDFDGLFSQFEAAFNEWMDDEKKDFEEWFESLNASLEGDVAANFAAQISTLQQETEELAQTTQSLEERKVEKTILRATLLAAEWDEETQTQTLGMTGVPAESDLTRMAIIVPTPQNYRAWMEAGIYADAPSEGVVVFHCDGVPEVDIAVNITIFD